MADTRLLIDFATGENWEMPITLYERFQQEQWRFSANGLTVIQQWIKSLKKEEQELIHKL